MGNTDKLNDFRLEAERLGIRVQPPSINASDVVFVPEEGTIRYALAAVKNVGRQAVATIVEERRTGGRFRDLTDFANRVNPRALNRRALENLACAGAFDSLEANRERVRRGCDLIIGTANLAAQARADGQSDMFGAGTPGSAEKLLLPEVEAPMPIDRLNQEHAALGLYLSGHPLDDYMAALRGRGVVTWSQFQEQLDKGSSAARLSGTVIYRKEKRNRNGGRFAFVGLSDPSGQYEVMVFSDQLHEVRDQLEPGRSVVLVLEADRREEGDLRLRVQSIEPVDTIAARGRRGLKVFVGAGTPLDGLAKRLGEGAGEVKLVVRALGGGHEVEIKLPGRYAVTPEVAGAIKALPGVVDVAEL
jgi:DNA polymerase-3 subunit alpha